MTVNILAQSFAVAITLKMSCLGYKLMFLYTLEKKES